MRSVGNGLGNARQQCQRQVMPHAWHQVEHGTGDLGLQIGRGSHRHQRVGLAMQYPGSGLGLEKHGEGPNEKDGYET